MTDPPLSPAASRPMHLPCRGSQSLQGLAPHLPNGSQLYSWRLGWGSSLWIGTSESQVLPSIFGTNSFRAVSWRLAGVVS